MKANNSKITSDQMGTSQDEGMRTPLHLSACVCNRGMSVNRFQSKRYFLGLTLSFSFAGANAMVLNANTQSQTNALRLLNTARLLREQRSSTVSAGAQPRVSSRPKAEQERSLEKHLSGKQSSSQYTSWQTLFDDESDLTLSQQEAFISSRVEENLPHVKSLRTSLGSEIPDMELHLQMEAAKVRALANGQINGSAAALAFMDLHHEMSKSSKTATFVGATNSISEIEKVAMSSLPSQLPGLATSVLHREIVGTPDNISRPESRQSLARKRSSTERSIKKMEGSPSKRVRVTNNVSTDKSMKKESTTPQMTGSRHPLSTGQITQSNPVRKIKSKDVSTIMSTRKALGETSRKSNKGRKLESPDARLSHEEELQLASIIQRGVELHRIKSKFEEKHGRDITRQEWMELAKVKGPKQLRRMVSDYRKAKNNLVMANMGLVHAVVRTKLGIRGSSGKISTTTKVGISYEEMVQEGSLGLLRAAELFDPSRGLKFSTYATIWIKGVLSNSNVGETITLPLREKTKWNKIQSAMKDLQHENGSVKDSHRPSVEEIARKSGMNSEEVNKVIAKMKRAKNVLSLDYQYNTQSRGGGEDSQYEALNNDKNLMDDVNLVERLHVRADVIAALARNLDPREARLMRLRYGLNDGHTRSIKDCAQAMGISQSRAQQLAAGCLKKLREADDAESLQEYLLSVA